MISRRGPKDKKVTKKPLHLVDLDQIPDNELPLIEKIYSETTGAAPSLHRSMSDEPRYLRSRGLEV